MMMTLGLFCWERQKEIGWIINTTPKSKDTNNWEFRNLGNDIAIGFCWKIKTFPTGFQRFMIGGRIQFGVSLKSFFNMSLEYLLMEICSLDLLFLGFFITRNVEKAVLRGTPNLPWNHRTTRSLHSYQPKRQHKKISDQVKAKVNGKAQDSEGKQKKPYKRIKN